MLIGARARIPCAAAERTRSHSARKMLSAARMSRVRASVEVEFRACTIAASALDHTPPSKVAT